MLKVVSIIVAGLGVVALGGGAAGIAVPSLPTAPFAKALVAAGGAAAAVGIVLLLVARRRGHEEEPDEETCVIAKGPERPVEVEEADAEDEGINATFRGKFSWEVAPVRVCVELDGPEESAGFDPEACLAEVLADPERRRAALDALGLAMDNAEMYEEYLSEATADGVLGAELLRPPLEATAEVDWSYVDDEGETVRSKAELTQAELQAALRRATSIAAKRA